MSRPSHPRQSSKFAEVIPEVYLGGSLGTVVGIGLGLVTAAFLHRLELGFSVEGLIWFAALCFAAVWGAGSLVVVAVQAVPWFTSERNGHSSSYLTIDALGVAVSLLVPAVVAFVLIVWWSQWVLPAGGVTYVAAYFVPMLRSEMSDPPVAEASATTRADLIGASLVGLGVGVLLGYITWFGVGCCARTTSHLIALALFVAFAALAFAPLSIAAVLRSHRLDDDTPMVAMGVSILIGFGLFFAAIALLGYGSS